jgi:adenosylcobinamide-GDP ribazoletransferase
MRQALARRAAELATAFGLLSRLPLGWLPLHRLPMPAEAAAMARGVWAYPLAGAVLGALGGMAFWLCAVLGLPPALSAPWCLAALLLLTGALHEDGLADTADGFGGGRGPARKLEIMRDSRIGSYGALALLLALAIRGIALASLAQPGRVAMALVVAAALGRGAMLVLMRALPPARTDGLAAGIGRPGAAPVGAGLLLAVLPVLLLPPGAALLAVAAAATAALVMALLARAQIGGQSGDVLGATAVLAECAVLTVLAGRLAA